MSKLKEGQKVETPDGTGIITEQVYSDSWEVDVDGLLGLYHEDELNPHKEKV